MLRSDDVPLAIALGANLPFADGGPRQTLLMVRPLLTVVVNDWAGVPLRLSWSPLFDTTPVGGPPDQPRYWNAVVVVNGLIDTPSTEAALMLLGGLHRLESQFGRQPILGTTLGAAHLGSRFVVLGRAPDGAFPAGAAPSASSSPQLCFRAAFGCHESISGVDRLTSAKACNDPPCW